MGNMSSGGANNDHGEGSREVKRPQEKGHETDNKSLKNLQGEADHKSRDDFNKSEKKANDVNDRYEKNLNPDGKHHTAGHRYFGAVSIESGSSHGKNIKVESRNHVPEKIQTDSHTWTRSEKNPQIWHVDSGHKQFDLKGDIRFKGDDLVAKMKYANGREVTYVNGEPTEIKHPGGEKWTADPKHPGTWDVVKPDKDNPGHPHRTKIKDVDINVEDGDIKWHVDRGVGKNHDREITSKNEFRDFKDGVSTIPGERSLHHQNQKSSEHSPKVEHSVAAHKEQEHAPKAEQQHAAEQQKPVEHHKPAEHASKAEQQHAAEQHKPEEHAAKAKHAEEPHKQEKQTPRLEHAAEHKPEHASKKEHITEQQKPAAHAAEQTPTYAKAVAGLKDFINSMPDTHLDRKLQDKKQALAKDLPEHHNEKKRTNDKGSREEHLTEKKHASATDSAARKSVSTAEHKSELSSEHKTEHSSGHKTEHKGESADHSAGKHQEHAHDSTVHNGSIAHPAETHRPQAEVAAQSHKSEHAPEHKVAPSSEHKAAEVSEHKAESAVAKGPENLQIKDSGQEQQRVERASAKSNDGADWLDPAKCSTATQDFWKEMTKVPNANYNCEFAVQAFVKRSTLHDADGSGPFHPASMTPGSSVRSALKECGWTPHPELNLDSSGHKSGEVVLIAGENGPHAAIVGKVSADGKILTLEQKPNPESAPIVTTVDKFKEMYKPKTGHVEFFRNDASNEEARKIERAPQSEAAMQARAIESAKHIAPQVAAHSMIIPSRPFVESTGHRELPVVRGALLSRLSDSSGHSTRTANVNTNSMIRPLENALLVPKGFHSYARENGQVNENAIHTYNGQTLHQAGFHSNMSIGRQINQGAQSAELKRSSGDQSHPNYGGQQEININSMLRPLQNAFFVSKGFHNYARDAAQSTDGTVHSYNGQKLQNAGFHSNIHSDLREQ